VIDPNSIHVEELKSCCKDEFNKPQREGWCFFFFCSLMILDYLIIKAIYNEERYVMLLLAIFLYYQGKYKKLANPTLYWSMIVLFVHDQ
jgi:hypothetical protein